MRGHIYYIGCGETQRVKIGYTKGSLNKRLRALQTGSPTKLSVLAWHKGSLADEQRLHHQFADERLHGEWFDMSSRLLAHLMNGAVIEVGNARCKGIEPPSWAPAALNAFSGDGYDWSSELNRALGIQ